MALNQVIAETRNVSDKVTRSNNLNRPIGIGVENLQDVFILMDWPFKQEEIKEDNHS